MKKHLPENPQDDRGYNSEYDNNDRRSLGIASGELLKNLIRADLIDLK